MPRRPMTPLDPARIIRRPAFRTGRTETWEAVSADGRWSYQRLEQSGTPWIVLDQYGAEWGETWHGTLGSARRATWRHDNTQEQEVAQ